MHPVPRGFLNLFEGSPYAVSEYSVNPTIGTVKELVDFRQRLHAYGLRLMLDFVPNHTGDTMHLQIN